MRRGRTTTTVSGASGATGAQGAPLTKDAFLAKANEICKQGGQKLDQEAKQFFQGLGLSGNQEPTSEQIQQFANRERDPAPSSDHRD